MSRKYLFALDLGTTKFCIAALDFNKENPITIIDVPAQGMRRGMLSDFNQAKVALLELLEKAEEALEVDIEKVVVGIAGSHLKGKIVHTNLNLEHQVITHHHVQELCQRTDQQNSSDLREVLHCIPLDYQLNEREPVDCPIGFSCDHISARYFVIDSDRSYLKDVIRLCNQVGLQVAHLYSEPFASASVSVKDEDKQKGVALADIGGGTTDGLVFQAGRPAGVFTINIAGMMMTRDLSLGLNIDYEAAEQLKKDCGLSGLSECYDKDIEIKTRKILSARILELGVYLAESLKPFKGQLASGLLLTGGGAQVKGVDQYLHEKFKVPVHVSNPVLNLENQQYENKSCRYATVIGLLNLEIGRQKTIATEKNRFWAKKYLNHFFNWIKELS